MKKTIQFKSLLLLLMISPLITNAQWGPVRFDSLNYFTHSAIISADSTISIGVENASVTSFLLRTTNSGATWDSLSPSSPGNDILFSQLFFVNNNDGFAGGSKNGLQLLMHTTDYATTWTDITPDPLSADPVNAISFIDNMFGFASTSNTLYKTEDGGITWTSFTPGFELFDVKFSDYNNGYIGGRLFPNAVVYKTTDGGVTWNNVLSATENSFNSPTIQKLEVISANEVVALRQYLNILYRTVDGGISWDTIHIVQAQNVVDFDFSDALTGHAVSNLSEIYGTNDGGATWALEYAAASGVYGPNVYLNSISFIGDIGYVCGSNGLIKRHDPSTTGVNDLPSEDNISFYPNPVIAGETLYIQNNFSASDVEIYNGIGALILKSQSVNSINTGELLPGVYFVKLIQSNSVQKLIVVDY